MSVKAKPVTEEERQELICRVEYRQETGEFFRRTSGHGHVGGAGSRMCRKPMRDGYYRLVVRGRTYLAHRAAWIIAKGLIPPGMQVDHIDHDRGNNRLENLRLVDERGNKMNSSLRRDNSSGVTGVTWSERSQRWVASISLHGKTIVLGKFTDKQTAAMVRAQANENEGFHPNHGMPKQRRNEPCSI